MLSYKILTPLELKKLNEQIRAGSDQARRKLVDSYQPLYRGQARILIARYKVAPPQDQVVFNDVFQAFYVAALEAVPKYKPELGSFSTFIHWYLKIAMDKYIADVKYAATLPVGDVRMERQVHHLIYAMERKGITITAAAVGKRTKVRPGLVRYFTSSAASSNAGLSFSAPLKQHDEGDSLTLMDLLVDDAPSVEDRLMSEDVQRLLRKALQVLDEREKFVVIQRRLKEDKMTLEAIGEKYAVSKERIRQVEAGALLKIRDYFKKTWNICSYAEMAGH